MKILIKIIVSALILVGSLNLRADANPDLWPYIQERMFQDTEIIEADFIKVDGPKRAASGAQVPVNIKLTKIEKKVSNLIAKDLKKQDIFFAGIDFIDQKLNGDINVTSPTGLKSLYDLSNINLAKTFWNQLKYEK